MKTTKAIIPAVAMTLLVAGCNFLDKAPTMVTTGSYYTTESDAESALNGVYAILTQSSFYGADYFYLTGGDDLEFYGGQGRSPADRGLCCNNATTSVRLSQDIGTVSTPASTVPTCCLKI